MDVFHCQRCGHWPAFEVGTAPTRQPYSLTSCGGLCCSACVQAGRQTSQCPLCQGGCKMMEINSQANAEIKTYFMDPQTIIKESMQKAFQVLQFQFQLQKSAVRLVGKLMNYQSTLKTENQGLKSQVSSLMQANVTMKEQVENLERKNTELQNTLQKQQSSSFLTPLHQNNSNPGNNGDIFNFLRQSPNRPNAQVQPIVQFSAQSAPPQQTPYPSPRSRERFSTRNPPAPPRSPMFSAPVSFRYPRSTTQQTPLSTVSTPSTICTLPSPDQFFVASSESPTLNNRNGQPTPDLIRRMRNMKCKWRT